MFVRRRAPPAVIELRNRGALFVVNHSAGKDSQAMLLWLRTFIPDAQLLLIHADLAEVEWPGNVEHIQATAPGLPLITCRSRRTLLQMIEERGMFPSPQQRQCTSDLKRGPIEREIRRHLKAHPEFGGVIVNCMGMRAQESPGRSKLTAFKRVPYENAKGKPTGKSIRPRGSDPGREWYDWLPIHGWETDEVFAYIRAAGQEPHPVYAQGMTRLSCCFCIMASTADLTTAARLNPTLYARYVRLEKSIGHTLSMSQKGLEEITGIQAAA